MLIAGRGNVDHTVSVEVALLALGYAGCHIVQIFRLCKSELWGEGVVFGSSKIGQKGGGGRGRGSNEQEESDLRTKMGIGRNERRAKSTCSRPLKN